MILKLSQDDSNFDPETTTRRPDFFKTQKSNMKKTTLLSIPPSTPGGLFFSCLIFEFLFFFNATVRGSTPRDIEFFKSQKSNMKETALLSIPPSTPGGLFLSCLIFDFCFFWTRHSSPGLPKRRKNGKATFWQSKSFHNGLRLLPPPKLDFSTSVGRGQQERGT